MPEENKTQFRLLVINPGSTSTKIGVFYNEESVLQHTIRHNVVELEQFDKIWDQYPLRKRLILATLEEKNIDIQTLSAVVGRGGLLRPVVGGTYRVNQLMIDDARIGFQGHHASNLGCVLAYGIAWDLAIDSFIVDPPCVDEMEPIAYISGLKQIRRRSLFHALNVRAMAREAARDMGHEFDELNLIVVHLGGGISVVPLRKGRAIDCHDALSGGPFTPERTGYLPMMDFTDLCFSGKYTIKEIKKMIAGKGGLVSYLGTNSAIDAEKKIAEGDKEAPIIYEAMANQIAKEIGSMAVSLRGKVDAIVITGGIAASKMLTGMIKERAEFIAPIKIYPGEDELRALAMGGLRVLQGVEQAKIYPTCIENN